MRGSLAGNWCKDMDHESGRRVLLLFGRRTIRQPDFLGLCNERESNARKERVRISTLRNSMNEVSIPELGYSRFG